MLEMHSIGQPMPGRAREASFGLNLLEMRRIRLLSGPLYDRVSRNRRERVATGGRRAQAAYSKFLFQGGIAYHQSQKFLNTTNATLF